jgi:hypothetical protein
MIYSNIPTHNFTKRQLKKIAGLSLKFCMDKFGVNNKKWYPLGLTIVHDMNDGYWGMYFPEINEIEIYPDACYNIGRFTSTIIHEYIHTLQKQDVRVYSRLLKEHGYADHPFEVEARYYEKKFNRELLCYLRDNW